ncbi:hypothetical protein KQI41_12510 [Tissierella pigra]|uniref:hypothetical protein n=1 Tax=Tissierella pigra TaxID=2607614 RepID=UPI001C0F84E6|nr:hypothetical protein [Tissierella pigra]MBU5427238.1 hypothetical protein [Tissierella pigra]
MNILEVFTEKNDLVEFICTKYNYSLWVPRFIVQELEEDNIFGGLDPSVTPQQFCQVCDGIMNPKSYTGIHGTHYEYKK